MLFIQCKLGNKKKGQDELVEFAKKCGAMPLWAYSVDRKMYLENFRCFN